LYRTLLQKRRILLRSLLIVATPYAIPRLLGVLFFVVFLLLLRLLLLILLLLLFIVFLSLLFRH